MERKLVCSMTMLRKHWLLFSALALSLTSVDIATTEFVHRSAEIFVCAAEELARKAKDRYDAVRNGEPERLVSGSDDFTLFLWQPEEEKKPIARMAGHQQLINDVRFSPDARLIASASFDKSVKLWDGRTGKFLATFRGHVSRVYQVAWSADSRLMCSGSSDSTLKVWDVPSRKLLFDLPGHADEVYSVDWSPDGQRVASGGKDKVLKM
ncbi:hypothetical protein BaRGS_00002811 [Batillaria attramentaria]|uniref:Uncharacterized protein n=1 Tax=Batillaria attramentaria TaxID=370345 RepID=A0ABD0M2E9_9CAEN